MATQNTTQNTTQTQELQDLLNNPVVQALVAQATSQAVAVALNSIKPAVKKGNTRATVKIGADDLLAKMAEVGLTADDVLLRQSARSGRWTLFTQFAITEEEAIEAMNSAGFEVWSDASSHKDYWQNHRIVRLYADIPAGCEESYKVFPLTSSVIKSKK